MAVAKLLPRGYVNDFLVTAPFLAPRAVTLTKMPKTDSERVFLNGLLLEHSCHTVVGKILTLDAGLDIAVGDTILIRYLA